MDIKDLQLVEVEQINAAAVFTGDDMPKLLKQIEKAALSIVPDLETTKGRKEIASLARKVASSKALIDDIGKEMVAEWKAKSKIVDNNRKKAREELDRVRDAVRQPLTDWEEAEQARIDAEALAIEIEACHEEAIEIENFITLQAEQAKREAELAAREAAIAEREAAIKKVAEEARAAEEAERLAAEEKKAQEQAAIEKAEADRVAAEKAEKQHKADIVKAEKAAEEKAMREAEERIEAARREAAEEAARVQAAALAEKEKERQALAAEKAAEEKRLTSKRHTNKINKEVQQAMTKAMGIHKDDAMALINAINCDAIPHVKINY